MGDYIDILTKHGACDQAIKWLRDGRYPTIQEAWDVCPRGNWLDWLCRNFLAGADLIEYDRQLESIRAECYRQHASIWAGYDRQLESIRAGYDRQLESIRAEYYRQHASIWAGYADRIRAVQKCPEVK